MNPYKKLYENLPVLVTGGCGFIGSHLVETLLEAGAKVTILDNLSTGHEHNIANFRKSVELINGTIEDPATCMAATRGKAAVFHLAAFVSVAESLEDPKRCYSVNVEGTQHILEASRKNNVQRLTFSSSAAVYGSSETVCVETKPTQPESPYGFSKLMGELLCQQYRTVFGLNTVIFRYFNVFGERQDPNGEYAAVVPKFRERMAEGKPITIFGDGQQIRDFVKVEEVVRANMGLAFSPETGHGGGPFNIASGQSITLLELADQLKQEFHGYNVEPTFMPARSGDIKLSSADCSKYKTAIKKIEGNL